VAQSHCSRAITGIGVAHFGQCDCACRFQAISLKCPAQGPDERNGIYRQLEDAYELGLPRIREQIGNCTLYDCSDA
jgi:hypothetical protein